MANFTGRNGIRERKDSLYMKGEEFVPSSGWTEDSNCHYLLIDLPGFKREVNLEVDYSGHRLTVSAERLVKDKKFSSFKKTYKLPENSDIGKISGKFDGELLHVTVPKKVIEKKELIEKKEELVNENYGNPEGIKEEIEHDNGTAKGIEEENEQEKPENKEDLSKENDKHGRGHSCHLEKKEKSDETSAEGEGFHEDNREKWRQEDSLLDSLMKKLNRNRGIAVIVALVFSLGVWVSRKSKSIRR